MSPGAVAGIAGVVLVLIGVTAWLAFGVGDPQLVPSETGAVESPTFSRELPSIASVYAYEGTGTSSTERVTVNPEGYRLNSYIPYDAIRPIYDPQFTQAAEVQLRPDDFVIGLSLNGDSRAYPLSILNHREMVNDVVGGIPVLVTW